VICRIVGHLTDHRERLGALIGPLPEQVVGYHGTSAEAVIEAAKTGFFPSRATGEDHADFFYMDAAHPGARQTAAEYAASNARLHMAQRLLGLPSVDVVFREIDEGNEDVIGPVHGLADDDEASGVLIGLGEAIRSLPVDADSELGYMSEPGEVCVRTAADGLPIRYVIGIEVLGDHDRELLAQAGLLETE
jgi:hypothetical protein